jgi:hypothetical protein
MKETPAYCGEATVEFVTADGTPVNDVFNYESSAETEGRRMLAADSKLSLYSTDYTLAGEYEIVFRFFYSNYPENFAESESWSVNVIDACDPPASYGPAPEFTFPNVDGVSYIVATAPLRVRLPEIETPNMYCAGRVVYTAESTAVGEGGPAVYVDGDELVVDYPSFLDLAGESMEGVEYPLTVTATLGDESKTSETTVLIKNPCIDPEFFAVLAAEDMADFSYVMLNDTETTWTHQQFRVDANRDIKEVCGELEQHSLEYLVDFGALNGFVEYDQETHTFSIFSSDLSLLSESPVTYTVTS